MKLSLFCFLFLTLFSGSLLGQNKPTLTYKGVVKRYDNAVKKAEAVYEKELAKLNSKFADQIKTVSAEAQEKLEVIQKAVAATDLELAIKVRDQINSIKDRSVLPPAITIASKPKIESSKAERRAQFAVLGLPCLLYTSPSPRDQRGSRMPSSA